jgi:hypothetical protein
VKGFRPRFLKADKIELWQLQAQSPIAKFIDKKRENSSYRFAVEDIRDRLQKVCRLE